MPHQREFTSGRYDYLVDPCDWYIIWDNVLDLPAVVSGEILAFSTEQEAATVAELLNRAQRPAGNPSRALERRCSDDASLTD